MAARHFDSFRHFDALPVTLSILAMSRHLPFAALAMVRLARPARARVMATPIDGSRRINAPLDPARFPA